VSARPVSLQTETPRPTGLFGTFPHTEFTGNLGASTTPKPANRPTFNAVISVR